MGWRIPDKLRELGEQTTGSEMMNPFQLSGMEYSSLTLEKSEHPYRERDSAENVYIVRHGLCFSYRYSEEGRRQIIDLAFPGDFLGLEALTQEHFVSSVSALTRAELVAYPVGDFTRQCYAKPALSRVLVECIAREQAVLTKRLVGVAHSPASQRIAHFLLEVRVRALRSASLHPMYTDERDRSLVTASGDFRIRLPQAMVADILGLSIVHVSRIMTRLKEGGLIKEASTGIHYCDLDGLKGVAMWEGLAPWFDET